MIVVGKDDFSEGLAKELGVKHVELETRTFPNSEINPRVMNEAKGEKVLVVLRTGSQEKHHPNRLVIETLLAVRQLKEMGAEPIVVWPWFPYSLQDESFRDGEPKSAEYVLDMLHTSGATAFFTVSAHMDRGEGKMDYYTKMPCYTLSGFKAIAEYLKGKVTGPVVIGPDFTSNESAKEVQAVLGGEVNSVEKARDKETGETEITKHDVKELVGKDVVVVDDIANTGGTLAGAIKLCKENGATKVVSCVVHPVLAEDCLAKVSGEGEFVATDTIDSPISKITVVPALAGLIQKQL
ncbi:ribose-phosphate diphosphokinase [archaeon]